MSQIVAGGIYKLINAKAGNALDLSGGDNKSIIGYDYHDGDNQKVRMPILSILVLLLRLLRNVYPSSGRPCQTGSQITLL